MSVKRCRNYCVRGIYKKSPERRNFGVRGKQSLRETYIVFALVPCSVLFARFASIAFTLEANRFFAAAPLAHRRHFFLVSFIAFPLATCDAHLFTTHCSRPLLLLPAAGEAKKIRPRDFYRTEIGAGDGLISPSILEIRAGASNPKPPIS